MPIRASMQDVVDYLRQWGEAATDDEFNAVTYWTDVQIQQIADKWSQFRTVPLKPAQTVGTTLYTVDMPNYLLLEDDFTVYRVDYDTVEPVVGTYNQDINSIVFASDLSPHSIIKSRARVIHALKPSMICGVMKPVSDLTSSTGKPRITR